MQRKASKVSLDQKSLISRKVFDKLFSRNKDLVKALIKDKPTKRKVKHKSTKIDVKSSRRLYSKIRSIRLKRANSRSSQTASQISDPNYKTEMCFRPKSMYRHRELSPIKLTSDILPTAYSRKSSQLRTRSEFCLGAKDVPKTSLNHNLSLNNVNPITIETTQLSKKRKDATPVDARKPLDSKSLFRDLNNQRKFVDALCKKINML